ncbi:hypothetical protein [Francisella sp. W12-1067]
MLASLGLFQLAYSDHPTLCNRDVCVSVKIVNETNYAFDYSAMYMHGYRVPENDSRRPLSNNNLSFGKLHLAELTSNPILMPHSASPEQIYATNTGSRLLAANRDHVLFSLMMENGTKMGLKYKGIVEPHYCSVTKDDTFGTVLFVIMKDGPDLKLYIKMPKSSNCSFLINEGFDPYQEFQEPPSSSQIVDSYYNNTMYENENNSPYNEEFSPGHIDYQIDVAKDPDLEKKLNTIYEKYAHNA